MCTDNIHAWYTQKSGDIGSSENELRMDLRHHGNAGK